MQERNEKNNLYFIYNDIWTDLNDFDEFLLNVSLDDEGSRVRVVDEDERRVDRHLAVHREEPVDLVRHVHTVQWRQRHRGGNLETRYLQKTLKNCSGFYSSEWLYAVISNPASFNKKYLTVSLILNFRKSFNLQNKL